MKKEKPWNLVKQHYEVTDTAILGFFKEHQFLSNFEEHEIEFEGLKYGSVEAAFQAAKCPLEENRLQFTKLSPAHAKRKGRTVELRKDWEKVKDDIMYRLCYHKFTNHPDLKEKLLATGDKYLEETNWWKDTYWGVYKKGDEKKGQNKLGHILMKIRSQLKSSL